MIWFEFQIRVFQIKISTEEKKEKKEIFLGHWNADSIFEIEISVYHCTSQIHLATWNINEFNLCFILTLLLVTLQQNSSTMSSKFLAEISKIALIIIFYCQRHFLQREAFTLKRSNLSPFQLNSIFSQIWDFLVEPSSYWLPFWNTSSKHNTETNLSEIQFSKLYLHNSTCVLSAISLLFRVKELFIKHGNNFSYSCVSEIMTLFGQLV